MIRNFNDELWKEISLDERFSKLEQFFVSNYGRIIRKSKTDEVLLPDRYINGYQVFYVKLENHKSKRRALYVHKIMAQTFLEQQEDHRFVIHLNYDKKDNKLSNLQWATKREKEVHQFKNPLYETKEKFIPPHAKLNEGRVRIIKRKLFDPNRKTRLKMIAKQFGITTMQLHRIKTGENWGHVVDY